MIDRTSTSFAPWHIIEANDKHLARVRVTADFIVEEVEAAHALFMPAAIDRAERVPPLAAE